jgi:hypothetical protein
MHTVLHKIDMQMLLVKGLFCAPPQIKKVILCYSSCIRLSITYKHCIGSSELS